MDGDKKKAEQEKREWNVKFTQQEQRLQQLQYENQQLKHEYQQILSRSLEIPSSPGANSHWNAEKQSLISQFKVSPSSSS